MATLSQAVRLTRNLAKGKSYDVAAARALRQMSFGRPEVTTVRIARIVNDIGADERDTLLSAVTKYLGKEGGLTASAKNKQLLLRLDA